MAAWRAKLDDGDMCSSCFARPSIFAGNLKSQFAVNVQFVKKMFIFGAHDFKVKS